MKQEELVEAAKAVVEMNNNLNLSSKEIVFWRERYLKDLPVSGDQHFDQYLRNIFMGCHVSDFMYDLDEMLQIIKSHYKPPEGS